jgi:AraC family ethanolamine operon transcriptional activator
MRHRTFRDFDAFAESVRDVESEMLLRNPARRFWSLRAVDLDGIDVQVGELGSGNIARGQLRTDGYLLYLPLSAVEYRANGVELQDYSCAVLEPGCEFCISTKVTHNWSAVFIPTELMKDGPDLYPMASRRCRVTCPDRQTAVALRAALLQIFDAAITEPGFESSPAAVRAAADVMGIAKQIVRPIGAVEPVREGRPSLPRSEIIRRAMDFLEQRPEMLVTCKELANAASVSERTLRTAFNEYFGVGPIRFLQLRQLNRIHRALKAAEAEESTVSQILIEHGEWAFSRFAARYRRLYGELPSDTLRRRTK